LDIAFGLVLDTLAAGELVAHDDRRAHLGAEPDMRLVLAEAAGLDDDAARSKDRRSRP